MLLMLFLFDKNLDRFNEITKKKSDFSINQEASLSSIRILCTELICDKVCKHNKFC